MFNKLISDIKAVEKVFKPKPTRELRLTEKDLYYLSIHDQLKLKIELVPQTAWQRNIRELFPKDWDIIRKIVYAQSDFKCEVCGEKGSNHPVEIHEVWHFNDKNGTQTLGKLEALCPSCHLVKHMGFAMNIKKGEEAFQRFITINGLDEETGKAIKSAVFNLWYIRSKKRWILDEEQVRKKVYEQTGYKVTG